MRRGPAEIVTVIKGTTRLALAGVMLLAAFGSLRAEEVEKKFRVGLAVGSGSSRSAIESDAANSLTVVDSGGTVSNIIRDPRNDSGALGSLHIEPAWRATISGQAPI